MTALQQLIERLIEEGVIEEGKVFDKTVSLGLSAAGKVIKTGAKVTAKVGGFLGKKMVKRRLKGAMRANISGSKYGANLAKKNPAIKKLAKTMKRKERRIGKAAKRKLSDKVKAAKSKVSKTFDEKL